MKNKIEETDKAFEEWFRKERIFDTLQGYEDTKAGWKAAMSRQVIFAFVMYVTAIIGLIIAFLVYLFEN